MSYKELETSYGNVSVRYAMLEDNYSHLHDGLEIYIDDDEEYVRVFEYYDIEDLNENDVDELINKWRS
jgi:hypothetical protein